LKTTQLPQKDEDQYAHKDVAIYCELADGTLILDYENALQRWDVSNVTLLQTFTLDSWNIFKVIELNKDTIASASEFENGSVIIWRVSTGELLHQFRHSEWEVVGIVKLSEGYFATRWQKSGDDFDEDEDNDDNDDKDDKDDNERIELWNEYGNHYATLSTILVLI